MRQRFAKTTRASRHGVCLNHRQRRLVFAARQRSNLDSCASNCRSRRNRCCRSLSDTRKSRFAFVCRHQSASPKSKPTSPVVFYGPIPPAFQQTQHPLGVVGDVRGIAGWHSSDSPDNEIGCDRQRGKVSLRELSLRMFDRRILLGPVLLSFGFRKDPVGESQRGHATEVLDRPRGCQQNPAGPTNRSVR